MIENRQIEDILQFYKTPCKVANVRQGGGYIDYYLNPVNGTTINKLAARVNDFTVAIGQSVSIALENMCIILRVKDSGQQQIYNYFDYINNITKKSGQLSFGINPRGEFVQYNLFEMPHLLVAGATGSGKSVFLHDTIIDLAAGNNAVLTLIDLKRVELSIYNGLNFVDGAVITDAEGARKRLEFEVAEMEQRYKIMEKSGVRNYKDLPAKKALAARVIIIDELADLMLNRDTRKSVENSIVRIAQLGRAAGCHLILATQRPSTDVITGLIKANIPCKLAFMTANAVDSRVIGVKGAENLSGRGDALLLIAGKKELERVQTLYIDDQTLNDFISRFRKIQDPHKYRKTIQNKRGIFETIKRLFG